MGKKMKLKLEDLKIKSFVTTQSNQIKGGTNPPDETTPKECNVSVGTCGLSEDNSNWPCPSAHVLCATGTFCTQTAPCSVENTVCTGNCCG